jgi:A/G-specific adenine glycosylase
MGQEHGGARLGHQGEGAVFLRKAQRPGNPRHFRARNLYPMQDQGRIGEAGAGEHCGAHRPCIAADGGDAAPALGRFVFLFTGLFSVCLFFWGRLGHGRIMPRSRATKQDDIPARLLAWYDIHRRVLPWRAPKGKRADPYRIWLSEIMLQQTTVQAVAAFYRKFLGAWPDVTALAGARQDEVLAAWAGLGYYARARNLHAAAKIVAGEMGGKFPGTAEGLRKLPGIGSYTAGAISAIAYDERQAAMDANAERVIARLYAVQTQMPKAKVELHARAQALVPARAGDFAQALMDLGSAICTPKRPACAQCPLEKNCKARKLGIQETLPVKAPKMLRPLKRGAAFVARDRTGAVLLVKRPDKGLLASMLEPPLGPWTEDFPSGAKAVKQAPFQAEWKKRPGIVRHGFTHFELESEVYVAQVAKRPNFKGEWVALERLGSVALPTVMRKIVEHGLDEGGPLFAQTSSARKR